MAKTAFKEAANRGYAAGSSFETSELDSIAALEGFENSKRSSGFLGGAAYLLGVAAGELASVASLGTIPMKRYHEAAAQSVTYSPEEQSLIQELKNLRGQNNLEERVGGPTTPASQENHYSPAQKSALKALTELVGEEERAAGITPPLPVYNVGKLAQETIKYLSSDEVLKELGIIENKKSKETSIQVPYAKVENVPERGLKQEAPLPSKGANLQVYRAGELAQEVVKRISSNEILKELGVARDEISRQPTPALPVEAKVLSSQVYRTNVGDLTEKGMGTASGSNILPKIPEAVVEPSLEEEYPGETIPEEYPFQSLAPLAPRSDVSSSKAPRKNKRDSKSHRFTGEEDDWGSQGRSKKKPKKPRRKDWREEGFGDDY